MEGLLSEVWLRFWEPTGTGGGGHIINTGETSLPLDSKGQGGECVRFIFTTATFGLITDLMFYVF